MLFLILFQLGCTLSKLIINEPKELAEQFITRNSSIAFSTANFGDIPWGHKMIGSIYIPDPVDGCDNFKISDVHYNQSLFYIVERGECLFVDKVLNAQKAGAKLVIIVDNKDEVSENIIMSDDGRGYQVKIPSIFIGKADGAHIINYLQHQEHEIHPLQVQAQIKFDTNILAKTFVYFGIDLSNQESYLFLREFHKYYEILSKNDVQFDIFYNIFECEECKENGYSVEIDDCLGGGRYCDYDPDGNGIETGREPVEEALRQLCIWKIDSDKWWHYMVFDIKRFQTRCIHPEQYSECSQKNIQKIKIDDVKVFECVENSFNKTSGNQRELMQNYILDEQIKFYENSGLLFYPGVLVNNQSYLGNFKAEDVFEEVCNSMIEPPYECKDYVEGFVKPQSVFEIFITIFYVLVASSLVIIIAVYLYKKYLVNREQNPELTSQVTKMVTQYIEFQETKDKKQEQL